MRPIDVVGKSFGRLAVLANLPSARSKRGNTRRMVSVRCDCGKEVAVNVGRLLRGETRSCGCLRAEMTVERFLTHGDSRLGRETPEYQTWRGMIQRCTNPKEDSFQYYGARGITVCERWMDSYENFLADMGRRPPDKHQIDRKDNDGPYAPENCRWATRKEQAQNRRSNRYLTIDGVRMSVPDACEKLGLHYQVVNLRLKRGWSASDALAPFHRGRS